MTATAQIDYRTMARRTVQALLQGQPPNGAEPDSFGPWKDLIAALYDAYDLDGTIGVRTTYDRLCVVDGAVMALIALDEPTAAPNIPLMPPLPEAATQIYQHLKPCAHWLDRYVEFALTAAPMTPRSFHETCALIMSSTAIARRLCFRISTKQIFPNLFALYIAPAGTRRKTTGMELMIQTLELAGLRHLLLPETLTPQRLIEKMSIGDVKRPARPEAQQKLLAEKAFAAQRAWFRDEVSALFVGMKREFMTGLLELILRMYDCGRIESSTISRGDEEVENTYLSFFGASNPDLMSPHLGNRSFWLNGLFSRFALLAPRKTEPFSWDFYGEPTEVPADVIAGLRGIYNLFEEPYADFIEDDEANSVYISVLNVPQPQSVSIDTAAFRAWETYSKATGFTMLLPDSVPEIDTALHASYSRFGTHAIKIAMNLAAMDTPQGGQVHIERAHYARAQQIVEMWRESMHALWNEQAITEETRLMQRIAKYLTKAGKSGMTQRDLQVALRANAKEVREALDVLMRAGRVDMFSNKAPNGRLVEYFVST
jgi:hypothetical protein